MCFSVQVDKDIVKLARMFRAQVGEKEFESFHQMQELENSMDKEDLKKQLGLSRKPQSSLFKESDEQDRIYPNYFAPVIMQKRSQRVIVPMRYRIRPRGSKEEIPNKYNVFNARIDSLEGRQTWNGLFGRNHGVFPFKRFFEWVEDRSGKKQLISFFPKEKQLMWAPCLWDHWKSKDESIQFYSFALITTNPPPEISMMGHDRCPIFLKETQIEAWLNPGKTPLNALYQILSQQEVVKYGSEFVA